MEEKKEIIFDRKLCEKKIEKPHIRDRICPNKMDTLFWCVFIAVYGYDEYNTISNHFSNREMEERQKMMDFLKKKPSLIKNSNVKITKVAFQEMLTDLMINKKVTLSILILFCIYYNITIFVVIDDIYMEFSVNNGENNISDKEIHIIHKNTKRDYEIDLNPTKEKLDFIFSNYIKIENAVKPLKGISNYTSNELKELLSKINKTEAKTDLKTKTDIYNYICEYCAKKIL